MGEGFFLIGLGTVVILLGLLRVLPERMRKDMPKETGYLRGQEIGSYIAMGLGGVLVVLGLGAVIVNVLT